MCSPLRPGKSGTAKLHLPIDSVFRLAGGGAEEPAIGVILSGTPRMAPKDSKPSKRKVASPRTRSELGEIRRNAAQRDRCRRRDYSLLSRASLRSSCEFAGTRTSRTDEVPPGYEDDEAFKRIFALVPKMSSASASMSTRRPPSAPTRSPDGARGLRNVQEYLKLLHEIGRGSALYEDIPRSRHLVLPGRGGLRGSQETSLPEILKHKAERRPGSALGGGLLTGEEVYSLAIALPRVLGGFLPLEHNPESSVRKPQSTAHREGARPVSSRQPHTGPERGAAAALSPSRARPVASKKACGELSSSSGNDSRARSAFSKDGSGELSQVLIYFGEGASEESPRQHSLLPDQPGFLLLDTPKSVSALSQFYLRRGQGRKSLRALGDPQPRSGLRPDGGPVGLPNAGRPRLDGILVASSRHGEAGRSACLFPATSSGSGSSREAGNSPVLWATGLYLEPPPGEPRQNILKMGTSRAAPTLRLALAQAKLNGPSVRKEGVPGSGRTVPPGPATSSSCPSLGPDRKRRLYVASSRKSLDARGIGR